MGRHFVRILGCDLLVSSSKDCVHCYCWKKVLGSSRVFPRCVCALQLPVQFPPPTDYGPLLLLPFGCYNMDLNLNRNGPQHGIDSPVPRKPKDKYKHTHGAVPFPGSMRSLYGPLSVTHSPSPTDHRSFCLPIYNLWFLSSVNLNFSFLFDADPLAFQDAFRPRRYRQVPQVLQVRVRRRRARSRWHEMAQAVLQMR